MPTALALNSLVDKATAQELRKDGPKTDDGKKRKLTVDYQKQALKNLEQNMDKKVVFPERLSGKNAEQIAEARKDLLETIKTQGEEIRQAPALKREIEEDYPAGVVEKAQAETKIQEQLEQLTQKAQEAAEEAVMELSSSAGLSSSEGLDEEDDELEYGPRISRLPELEAEKRRRRLQEKSESQEKQRDEMNGDSAEELNQEEGHPEDDPTFFDQSREREKTLRLNKLKKAYEKAQSAYQEFKADQQKELAKKLKKVLGQENVKLEKDELSYRSKEGNVVDFDDLLYFPSPRNRMDLELLDILKFDERTGEEFGVNSKNEKVALEKIMNYANDREGRDFVRGMLDEILETRLGLFNLSKEEKKKFRDLSDFLNDKAIARRLVEDERDKASQEYKEELGMNLLDSPLDYKSKVSKKLMRKNPLELVWHYKKWNQVMAMDPELIPETIAKKLLNVEGKFDWEEISNYRKANLRFALARNRLEDPFGMKEITKEDVIREAERLVRERDRVRSVEIFKDRPVLAVFSTEKDREFPVKSSGLFNAVNLLAGKEMFFDKNLTKNMKEYSARIAYVYKDIFLLKKQLLSFLGIDVSALESIQIISYPVTTPYLKWFANSRDLTKKERQRAKEIKEEIDFKYDEIYQLVDDSLRNEPFIDEELFSSFRSKALMERIKKEQPTSLEEILVSDWIPSKEKAKLKELEILKKMRDLPVPATFLFGMHGRAGDGALVASQIDDIFELTPKEMFDAYKQRDLKPNPTPEERDIFILGSCYSPNFKRKFYLLCDKENIPKPFFAGETELDHPGYAEFENKFRNFFYDKVVFNKSVKGPATLGNLIDFDHLNINSNPNFWGADDENHSMQFSDAREFDELEEEFGQGTLPV